MPPSSIRNFVEQLQHANELTVIDAPVSPNLEIAEIHRRVIAEGGPALLFTNVQGSSFPVVTNLFGTVRRVDLAFGNSAKKFVASAAQAPHTLMPPSIKNLWKERSFLFKAARVGLRRGTLSQDWLKSAKPNLTALPMLTTWPEDGGAFITLPLVYTEHPEGLGSNLGMYRIQRFDDETTGLHMQIGKGGGFHLAKAGELKQNLPVNIFIGGPPAAILAAIAPLPENVPELLLASLMLEKRLPLAADSSSVLPILDDAEFCLVGYANPAERRPEGPFGDHYGYYSLRHDFPVFHCKTVLHKRNAIYPATVVGKPRQEDFFIGDYLQELLSPLFPVVMPAVKDLWSYGETGYHSLAAAVVSERYKREALVSAFRILGEGQLSLTKFLLVLNHSIDLKDFSGVLEHLLERIDFRTDLYIFSHTSMDTLDYTGPRLNEGSKGVMLGLGEPIRSLPREFSGALPEQIAHAAVYCGGCLVLSGPSFQAKPAYAAELAQSPHIANWPLVVLSDNATVTAASDERFLWEVFTRFEPASDIHAARVSLERFHPQLEGPIVIDARMKPHYPAEVLVDADTEKLVSKRWKEYFPNSKN